jgi:hypothetical protein
LLYRSGISSDNNTWGQGWEHIIWHYQLGHVFPSSLRPQDHEDDPEESLSACDDRGIDAGQQGSDVVDDEGSDQGGLSTKATQGSEEPANGESSNSYDQSKDAGKDGKPENRPNVDDHRA